MNETDILLGELAERDPVRLRRGRFSGVFEGQALVDMGDSRFPCEFGDGYVPVMNEPVQVLSVGSRHLMFPIGAKPRVGTVLTVGAETVSVDTVAGPLVAIIGGGAPNSGDRVLITWTEDGPVTGLRLATTPEPPDPDPDPGGGGGVHTVVFHAIDTGSTDRHQARWWQAQPWASDSTYGAWFYGTQIQDTIPAGAGFVSLQFFVSWQQRQGSDPNFAPHNAAFKSGVPSYGPGFTWNPDPGWQTFPFGVDFFNHLRGGGGIGLNQGGFNKFSSVAQDAMTGALRISWRA